MKKILPFVLAVLLVSCKKEDEKPQSIYGKYSGICSMYNDGGFNSTITVEAIDNETVYLTFSDTLVGKKIIAKLSGQQITVDSQAIDSGSVKGYGKIDGFHILLVEDIEKYGIHYDCLCNLSKGK